MHFSNWPLHVLCTDQPEILFNVSLSGENRGFTCLQKQLCSQTPFRNSSPAPSPPPMSSVSLSRHGVHHQARPSSHSIACRAIIYRHLVFCLTSVWCWSSSLCLNESLVREGCGILGWISHLQGRVAWDVSDLRLFCDDHLAHLPRGISHEEIGT